MNLLRITFAIMAVMAALAADATALEAGTSGVGRHSHLRYAGTRGGRSASVGKLPTAAPGKTPTSRGPPAPAPAADSSTTSTTSTTTTSADTASAPAPPAGGSKPAAGARKVKPARGTTSKPGSGRTGTSGTSRSRGTKNPSYTQDAKGLRTYRTPKLKAGEKIVTDANGVRKVVGADGNTKAVMEVGLRYQLPGLKPIDPITLTLRGIYPSRG
ncbi:hypothetical protein BC829DRAFT_407658 [Chytridium lagenaria]|nr:hypothetical protein BC829DRAFT_407658 [Chytridium lagenaria]